MISSVDAVGDPRSLILIVFVLVVVSGQYQTWACLGAPSLTEYAGADDELPPLRQKAFYRLFTQIDQKYADEVESRYAELDCPVRVLWGQEDTWIPFELREVRAKRLADCPLTVVPNAGHLVQRDSPETIVAAVLNAIVRADPTFEYSGLLNET